LHGFVDHVAALAGRPKHRRCGADTLGDRHVDVFQDREAAEQPVDLKGAGDAELDALGLRNIGNVGALVKYFTSRRREHAGKQIDEGGLCRRRWGRSARGARRLRAGN